MSYAERRAMWSDRILSFKESGEKSVAAWCRKNHVNVNSMYNWLKKDLQTSSVEPKSTSWVPVQPFADDTVDVPPSVITVKVGHFSLEVQENFNPALFNQVLQVIQRNVK